MNVELMLVLIIFTYFLCKFIENLYLLVTKINEERSYRYKLVQVDDEIILEKIKYKKVSRIEDKIKKEN